MFVKICSFALIVYFASSITANSIDTTIATSPTTESKTAMDLLRDAGISCGDQPVTTYISRFLDRHSASDTLFPSKCICPLYCIINQLGLINNGGLNKVIVTWFREYIDFKYKNSPSKGSEDLSQIENYGLDRGFSIIKKLIENKTIDEACAESDELSRDIRLNETFNSVTSVQDYTTDFPIYTPSEESSEILESALELAQTCMPKFNTTLNDIYMLVSKDVGKTKENICAIQCILTSTSFGLFEKNGLNKDWVDDFQATATANKFPGDFNDSVKTINEKLSSLESKCNDNYDELTDLSAYEAMGKVLFEFIILVEKIRY